MVKHSRLNKMHLKTHFLDPYYTKMPAYFSEDFLWEIGDSGSNNLFDKSEIASEGICFTSPGFFPLLLQS